MAFSMQPLSFKDVKGAMDKALESEYGVKITCATHGAAIKLRHRMNAARTQDRRENKKVYPEDHVMYGNSPYDALVMRIPYLPDGSKGTVLHVVRVTEDSLQVEELTAGDVGNITESDTTHDDA